MRDEEAYLVIVCASALDGRALHVCRPVAQQRYRHHSSRRETCRWRRIGPRREARANAYVDYFKNFTLDSKPIHFDYLFAAKDSHESKRPKLTIKPLSKALGLDVNTDFKEQDYASLADELRSGPYSNKNILVCWHHGKIPELLASLGADPQKLLPPKGKWPEGCSAGSFAWSTTKMEISTSQCRMRT